MRIRIFSVVLIAVAVGLLLGCGKVNTDTGKCPSFAGQQILPQTGGATTQYVLWVRLQDTNANGTLKGMIAQAFNASGQSANKTLNLVREENDPLIFIRTFQGSDVCVSGTCTLYFHVIATSASNCDASFDTPLFQVVISAPADDDTQ